MLVLWPAIYVQPGSSSSVSSSIHKSKIVLFLFQTISTVSQIKHPKLFKLVIFHNHLMMINWPPHTSDKNIHQRPAKTSKATATITDRIFSSAQGFKKKTHIHRIRPPTSLWKCFECAMIGSRHLCYREQHRMRITNHPPLFISSTRASREK